MKRSGFTLIELLVVIAIIAILAAILFPVFERAKNKAQSAACMSNLKQVALAIQMYVSDWDQMLPNWSRGNMWPYTCANLPPDPATDCCHTSWGGTSGWLFKYTQSEDVLQCPAANPPTSFSLLAGTTKGVYYTYLANSWYSGNKNSDWTGYSFGATTYTGKSMDYFQYPSHFITFFDGQSYLFANPELRGTEWYTVVNGGGPIGTLYPNASDPEAEPGIWGNSGGTDIGGLKGVHNGMANCAFLDGHVKSMAPPVLWDSAANRVQAYYFDASGTGGQSQP